jgi:ribonuclease-3
VLKKDTLEKINALAKTLHELLHENESYVTQDIVEDCHALQQALQNFSGKVTTNLFQTPPSSSQTQPGSLDVNVKNIPKMISGHGLGLTGWKSSEIPSVLPDLPAILDPTLQEATFTHQGLGAGKITDLNYEKLEFIGDSYVELAATLLITQTFPFHTPGKCSHIRERLVKNATFAKYAKQYGLDKRLKLPDSFTSGALNEVRDDKQVKVLGDVFEAYVGAVVLSDPVHGLSRAIQWLKDLWGMEILDLIVQEERSPTHGIKSPIWNLGSHVKAVDQPDPSFAPTNHKDQLSKALGCKGIKISYKDAGPQKKDPATKLPIFTVGVYLDGYGEKDKCLAIGKANGKKEAGMKAAANVLADKKMMKFYLDKKNVIEAQQKMEAEALLKAGEA